MYDQKLRSIEREKEILQLIIEGRSNSEIANALYITAGTVNTHARIISTKLDWLDGGSQSSGGIVPRKPRPGSDEDAAEEVPERAIETAFSKYS